MKITFPIPTLLTALFVAAVGRLTYDAEHMLPWRIGRPHRKAAMTALGTPRLTLAHSSKQWKPGGITLPEDDYRLLRGTRQHVVISTTAPPAALPASLQTARAAARAIAEEGDGLVVDPLAALSLPTCARCSGEPADFRMEDDWIGWRTDIQDQATCPPWNPAETRSCTCLSVTSRGLRRFALPEITLEGAACAHSLCAINLLRAVAGRLLADHLTFLRDNPGATTRTIDDRLHIDDRAHYLGPAAFEVRLTPCDGTVRRLKVGPAPGNDLTMCLKVAPPSDFPGTTNDWLCTTRSRHLTPAA
ncbi:hypothetical protein OIE66_32855 [Nonomuraea sp. NBC_01738]|uniref:hypothetical protein n=1 Tax=Nonomuraea sp. NBC_01738 TaxID=2976003 RepID=UPI002E0DDBA4|nr:hypothetical protein OIE66_32855 [Nonomuraea sp. NBC_01738]